MTSEILIGRFEELGSDFMIDPTEPDIGTNFNFLEDEFEEKNDEQLMEMFQNVVSGFTLDNIFIQRPYKNDKPWNKRTNFLLHSIKSLPPVDIYINRQIMLNQRMPLYIDFPRYLINLKNIIRTYKKNSPIFYHKLYEILCKTFILFKNTCDDFKYEFKGTNYFCYQTKITFKPSKNLLSKIKQSKTVGKYDYNSAFDRLIIDVCIPLETFINNFYEKYGCEFIIFIQQKYELESLEIDNEQDILMYL